MNRTDRLHALIDLLREGDRLTAERAAATLGVTPRTIYRDMEVLQASGLPILGERGVGYRLTAPVSLPPLNLTLTELEALHLGLAVVAEAADPELRDAAIGLADKIDADLSRAGGSERARLAAFPLRDTSGGFRHMPGLRAAIRARQKLRIRYRGQETSDRTIRPLQLEYWGRVWSLTAWCELTAAFRRFRVERIDKVDQLPELFMAEPGKRMEDARGVAHISDQ